MIHQKGIQNQMTQTRDDIALRQIIPNQKRNLFGFASFHENSLYVHTVRLKTVFFVRRDAVWVDYEQEDFSQFSHFHHFGKVLLKRKTFHRRWWPLWKTCCLLSMGLAYRLAFQAACLQSVCRRWFPPFQMLNKMTD